MSPRSTDLPVSRAIAANVASLRAMLGWSQRHLAAQTEATGKRVGFSTICRMEKAAENGAKPVAVCADDLVGLAAALGVTPERLMTAPKCTACMDRPPKGFACRSCGAEA